MVTCHCYNVTHCRCSLSMALSSTSVSARRSWVKDSFHFVESSIHIINSFIEKIRHFPSGTRTTRAWKAFSDLLRRFHLFLWALSSLFISWRIEIIFLMSSKNHNNFPIVYWRICTSRFGKSINVLYDQSTLRFSQRWTLNIHIENIHSRHCCFVLHFFERVDHFPVFGR